jgi:LmbE family N-acetylglucosaminyl deacetylase
VDVTAQMEKKVAAVLAYRSQFPEPERMAEWLRSRARTYGMLVGCTYGEGFIQREVMQVDDVVTLPVASM